MATPLASATILDGASRHDVSVPVGTSVAGLMSMLQIDLTPGGLQLTHPDGRVIDTGSVLGQDLASGTVITLSGSAERAQAARQTATRTASPWLRPILTLAVFLTLVVCIETACLVGPAFGWWQVPQFLRISAAVVCAAAVGVSLTWWRIRSTAPGILAATTLIGICGMAFLPVDMMFSSQLAVAATVWTALATALAVWLIDSSSLSATMAALWALASVLVVYLILSDASALIMSALALAVATLAIATIPSFAFRIPETQLLDLPVVTTSAPTVRAPKVSSPSAITAARVRRTIREADSRNQLLLIACCTTVAVAAFPAARLMGTSGSEGLAAIGMMVIAFLALVLMPRARRDHSGRILPRVSAIFIAAAMLTSPDVTGLLGAPVTSLLVVAAAALISIFATVMARSRKSAFLGRVADVTQSLSLFLLLPAAVYGAGLFSLVRQIAS